MVKTVGVLGGGQLGRMLAEAANVMAIKTVFLDSGDFSPAKQVAHHGDHVDGSFRNAEAVRKLAAKSDVVTIEIEHVDTDTLEQISAEGADVQPHWSTIRTIQDKYLQKGHLHSHDVATAESIPVDASVEALEKASEKLGLPFMLKTRKDAYDGKGNYPIRSKNDFKPALDALGNKELYAERWANFRLELAVMVVKTKDQVLSYPTVETIHENSVCKLTYAPARGVSTTVNKKAQELARKAVGCFEGKGVFGVEMFLLADDTLLINEIAPRPHNSGHYTIEACPVSQYEAHLRAILDMPLSAKGLRLREPAIMLNILGGSTEDSHEQFANEAYKCDEARVHLYGKGSAKKGRKMGHITVVAPTMSEAESLIQPMIDYADRDKPKSSQTPSKPADEQQYSVAVVMGSDSDLPVLVPGLAILEHFNVAYTTRITSAHRTPAWMADFASSASSKGIKCIIAAAGGAAHLPGMCASHTTLPVIGIPVKPTIGDGTDSVLSILNMPRGVPVATVGVNNSTNAALLAVRFLAASDVKLNEKYADYVANASKEVMEKDSRLQDLGHEAYLAAKK